MTTTLVVAPSWVGDAVLSQPLLARLKARDPGGAIDVLAPAWAFPVFRRMPEVRATLALPFGHGDLKLGERRAFAKSLPRYDRAVVLPNSLKSALVPWHAGIPERIGYRGEWRYGLLTDVRLLDETAMPLLVDRFAALAQAAGEALERPVPAPRLRADTASLAATLAKHGLEGEAPVLALCPGAEYGPAKRWPARHFAEVARQHAARGWRVWLLGSAKDAGDAAEIAALAGAPIRDLAGRTSLEEAMDLLSAAARVASNDSGLMHIAAAFDRPMAAIFGSSSPGYTPPLSSKARIVTLGLACSPCFKRECPLGHTDCLEKLEPERVMAALD
jgi:heptosyltransferase-2